MTDEPVAYIGRDRAGIVCAACAADVDDAKDTIAQWLADGLTIERVPSYWVRANFYTANKYEPGAAA